MNDGGPAFPITEGAVSYANREFAMQGSGIVGATIELRKKLGMQPNTDLRPWAKFQYADAMLVAREAKP